MRFLILVGVFMLDACALFVSWDDVMSAWIGKEFSRVEATWGQADKKVSKNGNEIHQYHLKKVDPSCYHYWVVNGNGIIVDYYFEGNCRAV